MRGTGRFNLGLGVVGSAVGIGAALSTTFAGYILDHFGSGLAFWSLAAVAMCGLGLVWLLLPETRPDSAKVPRKDVYRGPVAAWPGRTRIPTARGRRGSHEPANYWFLRRGMLRGGASMAGSRACCAHMLKRVLPRQYDVASDDVARGEVSIKAHGT